MTSESESNRMEGAPSADGEPKAAPARNIFEILKPWSIQTGFPATKAVIAINFAVFVAMCVASRGMAILLPSIGLMIDWGGDYAPRTFDGQWWRMFTCMFLHFGLIHVAVNMWALWDLGSAVERLFGTKKFVVIYLISGLCGSALSLLWNPDLCCAGASGAIYGVLGAVVGVFKGHENEIDKIEFFKAGKSIATFILLSLVFGVVAGFDNAAHIGGLVSGFVLGWILAGKRSAIALYGGTALTCAVFVALVILATTLPFDFRNRYWFLKGVESLERFENNKAIEAFNKQLERKPDDSLTLAYRGAALMGLERDKDALADLDRAIELNPKVGSAYMFRARLKLKEDSILQRRAALADADQAIELKATADEALLTRAHANIQVALKGSADNFKFALKDIDKVLARSPDNQEALAFRAYVQFQGCNYGDALTSCNRAIAAGASQTWLVETRAKCYARLKDYKNATGTFDQLIALHDGSEVYYCVCKAKLLRAMGETKSAVQVLDDVVRTNPNSVSALTLLAYIFNGVGSEKQAQYALQKALCASVGKNPADQFYFNRAAARYSFGDYAGAVRDCDEVLALQSDMRVYASLLKYLALEKSTGNPASVKVTYEPTELEKTVWPYPIFQYFSGARTKDKDWLFRAARTDDELVEAKTYVALDLISKRQPGADDLLSWVINNGNRFLVEYDLAGAEFTKMVREEQLQDTQPTYKKGLKLF
ncbi:MAG: rhomboid family intramembrane serine protease [Candidatus Obscuribacterales bacterium]|nr:rhomboid family intramembrane serine protease [Candidatus Obscuribacterales bacterium]